MFIRTKLKANNKVSIQIVESVRKGTKVIQKIIDHVGLAVVGDDISIEGLKRLAQEKLARIEQERNRQPQLFDEVPAKLGRKKKKEIKDILPPSEVSLDDIVEEKRIIEGVDDIAGAAYDALGYDKLLLRGSNKLLKDLVLARLVYPHSKHKLQQILSEQFAKEYDLNQIYRLMDQIHPQINKIKQITCAKTRDLMPNADILLFDVTTLHFESIEEDELRDFGYSKNFRFNTTQVVLALATNECGLPLGYELFRGDQAEVKTLVASITKWESLFKINSVCFVGDRAMFSKANLALLEERNYQYVIAAKLRSLSDNLQQDILDEKNYRVELVKDDIAWMGKFTYDGYNIKISKKVNLDNLKPDDIVIHGESPVLYYKMFSKLVTIKENERLTQIVNQFRQQKIVIDEFKTKIIQLVQEITGNKRTIHVSYGPSRARNDYKKRNQIIDSLKPKIGKTEKLIKNGAKKYITTTSGETKLDNDKIEKDQMWDGMHGIISNIQDKKPQELLAKYHSLWHIEESFRVNKHNLKMRPIYHHSEKRIESHIALCYMTFAVLRRIQYQVELTQIRYSPQQVLDVMLSVQASIHVHKKTKDRYKLPSAMSSNARCLYKAFGIDRSVDASIYLP